MGWFYGEFWGALLMGKLCACCRVLRRRLRGRRLNPHLSRLRASEDVGGRLILAGVGSGHWLLGCRLDACWVVTASARQAAFFPGLGSSSPAPSPAGCGRSRGTREPHTFPFLEGGPAGCCLVVRAQSAARPWVSSCLPTCCLAPLLQPTLGDISGVGGFGEWRPSSSRFFEPFFP